MSGFSFLSLESDGIVNEIAILLAKNTLCRSQMENASNSIVRFANKARKLSIAGSVFPMQYFDDKSIFFEPDFKRSFWMPRSFFFLTEHKTRRMATVF